MIEGVINKSNSEFKDVLVAANSDSVIIDNNTNWATFGDVDIEINTDLTNVGDTENIVSFGASAGDKFRLTRWSNGTFRAQLTISSVTTDTAATWDFSKLVNIKINSGIIYVDDVLTLDISSRNAESLFSFPNFNFGSLSYATSLWYTNQILHDIPKIDLETFKPSGNGLTYTGSNGTVVTRNTSALDPVNYVNQTLIQKIYGSDLNYKDVLTAANSDYESIGKSFMWVQSSEIDIEFNINIGAYTGQDVIFSTGNVNSPSTGAVTLRRNNSNELRLVINGFSGSGIVGTPITAADGLINIAIKNSDILVNGVSVATVPTLTINVDSDALGVYVGKFTYQNSGYLDGDVFNFTINGELFKPSGNGLTYKGSNGTVVTRNTSALDPVNYVNQTLIQKIYGSDLNYKDVLTAANSDFLSLPSTVTLLDGDSFVFNVNVVSLSNTQVLGGMGDSTTYTSINSNTLFVKLSAIGFSISGILLGDNELLIRRVGTTYYASVNGGAESSRVDVGDFKIEFLGRLGAGFFDGLDIYNFTLNTEQFNPSGNGLTYKGSEGTVVTRNTSALDPINYYNLTAIQKI